MVVGSASALAALHLDPRFRGNDRTGAAGCCWGLAALRALGALKCAPTATGSMVQRYAGVRGCPSVPLFFLPPRVEARGVKQSRDGTCAILSPVAGLPSLHSPYTDCGNAL